MGKTCIIDASDAHLFEGWNWQAHKGRDGKFYARRNRKVGDKMIKVHVHHMISGHVPEGYVPHHDDGDGLNNRRKNLSIIPNLQNILLANKRPRSGRAAKKRTAAGRSATIRFDKRYGTWSVQLGMGSYKTRADAIEAKAWIEDAIAMKKAACEQAAQV
jgi:hypothetical protein